MDCSLPGSSIHGIFQARVSEWGAIAFSRYEHEKVLKHSKHAKQIDELGKTFPTAGVSSRIC